MAVLMVLAGRLYSGHWSFKPPLLAGGAGVGVGLVLLAVPAIVRPIYLVWYFVASCVGLVIGNLLLAGAFYVFVTGIGLLKRAFGRNPIHKTFDRQATSYWQDATQPNDPQRYYRQF